jgi:hypothetical protein
VLWKGQPPLSHLQSCRKRLNPGAHGPNHQAFRAQSLETPAHSEFHSVSAREFTSFLAMTCISEKVDQSIEEGSGSHALLRPLSSRYLTLA